MPLNDGVNPDDICITEEDLYCIAVSLQLLHEVFTEGLSPYITYSDSKHRQLHELMNTVDIMIARTELSYL
jgi:hypothetical protein